MGGKSAPDPPDMSGVAAASEKSAKYAYDIAKKQLAWSKEMWADQKEAVDKVMDLQLGQMEEQWDISQQDRARYEEFYQPLEEEYLDKASQWNSAERQASESAKAQTEVASNFEAQRQNHLQRLEGYGVDPSTTRNAALDVGVRVEQAKAQAQASNAGRTQIEREGLGMLGESINVGRGLPAQGLNYAAQSIAAGNSGAGQAGAWQAAGNAMGNPNQWQNSGNQAVGQWGNTLSQDYQNQLGAHQANQASNPLNTIAGLAATGASAYFTGGASLGFAEGGEARAIPEEGLISGPGGPKGDAIPARVSDGEYIMPAEVVRRKGTEFFDKLVAKVREEEEQRGQTAQVTGHALALPPPQAIQ